MIQLQKKQWIGWSGTPAHLLFMGWNNIIFENSYEEIPTYPQNPLPNAIGLSPANIPGFDRSGMMLDIIGIDLSETEQMNISTMTPTTLHSWLKLRIPNYDNSYNINEIDVIRFFGANKVVTVLTNGFAFKANVEKMKYVFLKDWGFSINFNLSDIPTTFVGWAQAINAKDLLIKPKNLKYGAVYLAGKLDSQWGGMTIYKD